MDHNRTVFLSVFPGVFAVEFFRQLHIQLNGAALPGTADGVLQMEVDLWAVESAVAFVDNVIQMIGFQRFAQAFRGQFPGSVVTHGVLRTGRQFCMVFQTESGVHFVEQFDYVGDFRLDLFRGHEDMGIVLGEAADTE